MAFQHEMSIKEVNGKCLSVFQAIRKLKNNKYVKKGFEDKYSQQQKGIKFI